jgi:hypothetical protein
MLTLPLWRVERAVAYTLATSHADVKHFGQVSGGARKITQITARFFEVTLSPGYLPIENRAMGAPGGGGRMGVERHQHRVERQQLPIA